MSQTGLSPDQIRSIAEAIAREIAGGGAPAGRAPLGGRSAPSRGPSPAARRPDPLCGPAPPRITRPQAGGARGGLGDGVFQTLDEAVNAAVDSFFAFGDLGLERRRIIVESLRGVLRQESERLAREAWEETGLGRYEDKIQKNNLVIEKTPGPEILVPQAMSGDYGLVILEPAPYGVIGAITPVTNPTSTIICNTIGMIAAGNSVVFNVHPSARKVSAETIRVINRAIVAAGGPPNLATCIAEPTLESAQALMTHKKVRLLVITGGPGVVRAAMNSGKRAICGGPGNPPVVVDATADIEQAASRIVYGHSFDNNVICVDEKECIVVDAVADDLKRAMTRHGAVELPTRDLARLEKVIFTKGAGPRGHATVNKDFVGKNASLILKELGVHAGPEVRCITIEVPNDHPLIWTEQMMPVLPITRVRHVDEGIALAVEAEGGNFHTAAMHSNDIRALSKMARDCNCSIFAKNGTGVDGLGHHGEGYTSFTIASPTGEGLTTASTFSRWRRCTLRDDFRIV